MTYSNDDDDDDCCNIILADLPMTTLALAPLHRVGLFINAAAGLAVVESGPQTQGPRD